MKVVDRFKVGDGPQHIVPSWDLRTLWVTNNAERRTDGSLTPIDPRTGKPGKAIPVDDPYNMYFTPDGKSAIVVAEARKRLDFRDPHTMAMQYSIDVPGCGASTTPTSPSTAAMAIFTCEFAGTLAKIDLVERKVLGYLKLQMPATRFKESGAAHDRARVRPGETEVCTAKQGHAAGHPQSRPTASASTSPTCMPTACTSSTAKPSSRSASSRPAWARTACTPAATASSCTWPTAARTRSTAPRGGNGSVTVIDFATEKVVAHWAVPGGGSPDMGNVSADGKWLWLSGRYDDVVYRFDTSTGEVHARSRSAPSRTA